MLYSVPFWLSFFPTASISAILRHCSDVPSYWCSSVLSLFGKAFLSKFVLNFKTNANTLLVLFQLDKCVSNFSNISVFTSILLTRASFLVSRSSLSISFIVWYLFHDSGSQRNFGPSYHILTFANQVPSNSTPIVCRVAFSWNILPLSFVRVILYCLYLISHKSLETSCLIFYVTQKHLTVCPKYLFNDTKL